MKDNERKVMTRSVNVGLSKKGNLYLFTTKNDKRYFVNLVKDNKGHYPKIPAKATSCEIEFTSFLWDTENSRLVLFDVRDIVFKS